MNMFTIGQAARIWTCIDLYRSGLTTSLMCDPEPASVATEVFGLLSIGPVPTFGPLSIGLNAMGMVELCLFDMTGRLVMRENKRVTDSSIDLDLTPLLPGTYELRVSDGLGRWLGSRKVVRS